jgi:putative SOS response-associated peptidase YedK
MCGRFTRKKDKDLAKIMTYYGITETTIEVEPRYNIAPTQIIPAVNQQRQLVGLKWDLIPSWAKDPAIGNKMINARAETLQEKPSFKIALAKRRCLIPPMVGMSGREKAKPNNPTTSAGATMACSLSRA